MMEWWFCSTQFLHLVSDCGTPMGQVSNAFEVMETVLYTSPSIMRPECWMVSFCHFSVNNEYDFPILSLYFNSVVDFFMRISEVIHLPSYPCLFLAHPFIYSPNHYAHLLMCWFYLLITYHLFNIHNHLIIHVVIVLYLSMHISYLSIIYYHLFIHVTIVPYLPIIYLVIYLSYTYLVICLPI